jgi:hypothetical protein
MDCRIHCFIHTGINISLAEKKIDINLPNANNCRKSRRAIMLVDRAEASLDANEIVNYILNSLILESCNRFSSIQDRRHTIVRKDIWRNLSKNVVGSQLLENATWTMSSTLEGQLYSKFIYQFFLDQSHTCHQCP